MAAPDSPMIQSEEGIWLGRTIVDAGEWIFTFDQRSDWSEVRSELAYAGGHAVTHVGAITLKDGSEFPVRDAFPVLEAVAEYVSLMSGRWITLILPVGLGADDEVLYEGWESGVTSFGPKPPMPWPTGTRHHPTVYLGDAEIGLSAYLKLRRSALWGPVLPSLMEWFLEAWSMSGGLATALALEAATLDLLAWTLFTQNPAIHEQHAKKFERLPRAEALRHLEAWAESPEDASTIASMRPQENPEGEARREDRAAFLARVWEACIHPSLGDGASSMRLEQAELEEAHRLGLTLGYHAIRRLVGYYPHMA